MPFAQKHPSESKTFPTRPKASLSFKPQAMPIQALVKQQKINK
jgi:hypothetical protein